MEKFFLRVVLADQELQVIDHQHIDAAKLFLELHRRLAADCGDEAIHEFFGRHVSDRDRLRAVLAPQFPGDGMHQVGLAQADAAVQEQRIEADARRLFGDAARAGIGKLIGLADDEVIEREPRIEHRQFGSGLAILGRRAPRGAAPVPAYRWTMP